MKDHTSQREPATEELFDRFRRQRDVEALGRLFDETAPELLRIARALTSDPAVAEDGAIAFVAHHRTSFRSEGSRLS